VEELELTSSLVSFEIFRVPYLLEFGYDEDESASETHLERMKRKFSGSDFESCTFLYALYLFAYLLVICASHSLSLCCVLNLQSRAADVWASAAASSG
jgi:hypothetical protein